MSGLTALFFALHAGLLAASGACVAYPALGQEAVGLGLGSLGVHIVASHRLAREREARL